MDIGLQEIVLISVIALIILGPERLPVAIKTLAVWISRIKRGFNDIKRAVEDEVNADEIRRQIHNETILHELGEARDNMLSLEKQLNEDLSSNGNHSDTHTDHPTDHRAGNQIASKLDSADKKSAD